MQRTSAPHAARTTSTPSSAPTAAGPRNDAGSEMNDEYRSGATAGFLPGFLTDPLVSRAMGLAATSIGDPGARPRSASTAANTMAGSTTDQAGSRHDSNEPLRPPQPHQQHPQQQHRRRAESMPEPASKPRRNRPPPIATQALPDPPVLFPGASFRANTRFDPSASRRPTSGPATEVRTRHRAARRELRIEQQASLQKGRRQSSRKYRGVLRKGNWWLAQVKVEGRVRRLGRFATAEDAAKAYDEASVQLRGPKAVLNFPADHENRSRNAESMLRSTVVRETVPNATKLWCDTCLDDAGVEICETCGCAVCLSKMDASSLLLCSLCQREYHRACITPGAAVPDSHGRWICPICRHPPATTDTPTNPPSNAVPTPYVPGDPRLSEPAAIGEWYGLGLAPRSVQTLSWLVSELWAQSQTKADRADKTGNKTKTKNNRDMTDDAAPPVEEGAAVPVDVPAMFDLLGCHPELALLQLPPGPKSSRASRAKASESHAGGRSRRRTWSGDGDGSEARSEGRSSVSLTEGSFRLGEIAEDGMPYSPASRGRLSDVDDPMGFFDDDDDDDDHPPAAVAAVGSPHRRPPVAPGIPTGEKSEGQAGKGARISRRDRSKSKRSRTFSGGGADGDYMESDIGTVASDVTASSVGRGSATKSRSSRGPAAGAGRGNKSKAARKRAASSASATAATIHDDATAAVPSHDRECLSEWQQLLRQVTADGWPALAKLLWSRVPAATTSFAAGATAGKQDLRDLLSRLKEKRPADAPQDLSDALRGVAPEPRAGGSETAAGDPSVPGPFPLGAQLQEAIQNPDPSSSSFSSSKPRGPVGFRRRSGGRGRGADDGLRRLVDKTSRQHFSSSSETLHAVPGASARRSPVPPLPTPPPPAWTAPPPAAMEGVTGNTTSAAVLARAGLGGSGTSTSTGGQASPWVERNGLSPGASGLWIKSASASTWFSGTPIGYSNACEVLDARRRRVIALHMLRAHGLCLDRGLSQEEEEGEGEEEAASRKRGAGKDPLPGTWVDPSGSDGRGLETAPRTTTVATPRGHPGKGRIRTGNNSSNTAGTNHTDNSDGAGDGWQDQPPTPISGKEALFLATELAPGNGQPWEDGAWPPLSFSDSHQQPWSAEARRTWATEAGLEDPLDPMDGRMVADFARRRAERVESVADGSAAPTTEELIGRWLPRLFPARAGPASVSDALSSARTTGGAAVSRATEGPLEASTLDWLQQRGSAEEVRAVLGRMEEEERELAALERLLRGRAGPGGKRPRPGRTEGDDHPPPEKRPKTEGSR